MFTRFKDYKRVITEEDLNEVIDHDIRNLRNGERSAQEEIESYLRHHFDVGIIFKGFTVYSASATYAEGDLISFKGEEGELYTANEGSLTGVSPTDDPSKWTQKDPRHQYLLQIFMEMTLFHAHKSKNYRNIPDLRNDAYSDAISWLKMVNAGKVTPDFPILENPIPEGRNIHSGTSSAGLNNTY